MSYALQVAEEMDSFEPTTYQEAISYLGVDEWMMAMTEEIESLQKNQTWDLVVLPESRWVLGCKLVFKKKSWSSTKEVICYKACLVAKGYSQKEGVDYNEIFSPVVWYTSISFLLFLTETMDMELEQLDVKTSFLHGRLEENILM